MTTVDIPAPTTGPSARLQLNDPATLLGILATIGAVALRAIPAIAHWHIDQLYPAVAMLAVAIYDAVVVGKKHDLAGALATVGTPIEAVLEKTAPLVGVDPQMVEDLKAELAALKENLPALASQAVAGAFVRLATQTSQAVAGTVAPVINGPSPMPPAAPVDPPPPPPPA